MHNGVSRYFLKASAIASTAIICLFPELVTAHSAKPHPFKTVSINFESAETGRAGPGDHRNGEAASVRVIHNGATYTRVEGNISAVFRLKAKVKARRRVVSWIVTTGDPANERFLPENLIGAIGFPDKRKVNIAAGFVMDANRAVSSGSWGSDPMTVQKIVDSCNAAFSQLPAEDEIIDQFELTIHAGFAAAKRRSLRQAGDNDRDWLTDSEGRPGIAHTTLPVNIVCAGHQEDRSADVTPPRAGNELYSIDFKVEQHGESCPKDVTVTAYADYRWPATSRMQMRVNGGAPKMRIGKTRKVTFAGKTFHRAERQFKYKLDPGQRTFTLNVDGKAKTKSKTIEIKCPPFKVLSVWLDYDVEDTPDCPKKVAEKATFRTTRPGWVDYEIRMKGGLVVSSGRLTSKRKGNEYVAIATRDLTMSAIDTEFIADAVDFSANSGWVPLRLECLDLAGEITVADSATTPKNECPRQGQTVFKINSNMDSPIDYKVECSGGRSWQGTMSMEPKGAGKFQGVGAKNFDVSKTEVVSCVLKRVKGNKHYVLSFGGHQFSCANRVVDTASDDIATEPSQDTSEEGRGDFTVPQNCDTHWKTTCTKEPKKVCRKEYDTVCKMVPNNVCKNVTTRTCKNVKKTDCTMTPTRSCKRVPTLTCKTVRGNKVCERTYKTQCTTQRKRVCKAKTVRQCNPTTKRVCERKSTKQCERVANNKCETTWTKSCKREKKIACR